MISVNITMNIVQLLLILARFIVLMLSLTIYRVPEMVALYIILSVLNDGLYKMFKEEAIKTSQPYIIGLDLIAFAVFLFVFGMDALGYIIFGIIFKLVMYSS